MKRIICDTCQTQTEPDPYGSAPGGSLWLSITHRKDYKLTDFCSPKCAIEALALLAAPVAVPAIDHGAAHEV